MLLGFRRQYKARVQTLTSDPVRDVYLPIDYFQICVESVLEYIRSAVLTKGLGVDVFWVTYILKNNQKFLPKL